jgi:hypothetical protein
LAVLVDESAAGGVSSDWLAGPVRDDVARVGCALAEAAVRSVRVVVLDVLDEELFEVAAVPDEGPVAEFAACGADPSVRFGIRFGADDRSSRTRSPSRQRRNH